MHKHRRRLLIFSLCGAAGVATTACSLAAKPGINRAGYDQIREGMTLKEVNAVLGKPPGNYRTKEIKHTGEIRPDTTWWKQGNHEAASGENWDTDECNIWVGFSKDGKAVGKHFLAHDAG